MGTTVRPEVSEKNKYWIERHRYYELKHFCLQYPLWKKAYAALDGLSQRPNDLTLFIKSTSTSDPTARCAIAKSFYSEHINLIEKLTKETDYALADYLLKGITIEGMSFDKLLARYNIPCSKDTYYDRYRKFFWLLNRERG